MAQTVLETAERRADATAVQGGWRACYAMARTARAPLAREHGSQELPSSASSARRAEWSVVALIAMAAVAGAGLTMWLLRTGTVASAASALLAIILVFGLLGRGVVRRRLNALDELRRGLREIRVTRSSELSFASRWQIEEVDGVAIAVDALLTGVRAAVERERRFVADASHELRTPLTVVRGQLELLATEPDIAERASMLRSAQRSCELLVRTTESLLALAREEASLVEAVDISEIAFDVRGAQLALGDAAIERRLVVDAPAPALVRGDPQLLRLAINNVVDNALKYSAGRVTVRVSVTDEDAPGALITCVVEDEGPGIPEAQMAWLRKPFARGASTGQKGTGLGLALVDHVARVHGGSLALRGGAAGGLDATLTLPAWTPAARPTRTV